MASVNGSPARHISLGSNFAGLVYEVTARNFNPTVHQKPKAISPLTLHTLNSRQTSQPSFRELLGLSVFVHLDTAVRSTDSSRSAGTQTPEPEMPKVSWLSPQQNDTKAAVCLVALGSEASVVLVVWGCTPTLSTTVQYQKPLL